MGIGVMYAFNSVLVLYGIVWYILGSHILLVFGITTQHRFDGAACSHGDAHFRYQLELHRRLLPSQVDGGCEYGNFLRFSE